MVLNDATLRQTLHMSIGGDQIRIRFSNVFGGSDLPITAATISLPTNGAAGVGSIQNGTTQTLTFSGSTSIVVPNGALVVSDPLNFAVKPQSMITVTTYFASGQQGNAITGHPGSRTTSWMATGNQVNAANVTGASTAHW